MSVVSPDPPRTADNHEFLFDLIVSQGIEAPRRAGLVTVLQRDDRAERASYAVAVSLPEQTSGYQIVQCAEYLHGCQLYECRIRLGWENMQFTMEPAHDTQDGDSFIVAVASHRPGQEASSHDSGRPTTPNIHDSHRSDEDMPDDHDEDSEMPSPSLAESTSLHVSVHIHRLGHQQSHGRIRWDTIDHVLLDVSRVLNVPIEDVAAFHHLQAIPADQSEQEEAIILQHVLDIPAGSTEKLVLVDVEMHQPNRIPTMPRAPPVSRQVHRVAPTLVRQHILLLTQTEGYFAWHPSDCLVFCNSVLLPQQDLGPQRIEHGLYFRVVVPPPPFPHWDIGLAIRTFHGAVELFELPEAGHIATEMMNRHSGSTQEARTDSISAQVPSATCKGADLDADIDVPMMSTARTTRLGIDDQGWSMMAQINGSWT